MLIPLSSFVASLYVVWLTLFILYNSTFKHIKHVREFRNKTSVPVFYRGNKVCVRVRVRMNQITSALEPEPERVPIIDFRDKTKVQMFYFDSNTTAPLQCDALVFLESVC